MSRRERGRASRSRWPWGGLLLAAVALWAGFRWTNRLLYPGPGRPPGETLKFAEPRPEARLGGPDEPLEVPATQPGGIADGARPAPEPPGKSPAGREAPTTGELGDRAADPGPAMAAGGSPAKVPAPTATPVRPTAPTPSGTSRARPTASAAKGARKVGSAARPRESFDDIDRRTLEAILERREREKRSRKPQP